MLNAVKLIREVADRIDCAAYAGDAHLLRMIARDIESDVDSLREKVEATRYVYSAPEIERPVIIGALTGTARSLMRSLVGYETDGKVAA